MDRWTTLCGRLAFLVSAAGVVCFYLAHRFSGLGSGLADHVSLTLANPVVPVAAVVALAAVAATWVLERYGGRRAGGRPAGVQPAAKPPAKPRKRAGTGDPEARGLPRPRFTESAAESARAAANRRRLRLRSRLEAHLAGAGDIVAFVDDLLSSAVQAGASDVHLQPLERSTRVTFRVGGELDEAAIVPRAHHEAIVRRLKILARLIPYHTDRPQDGHIVLDGPLGGADLRVSVLPTNHGEKVVLRLARAADALFDLDRLGMPEALRDRYRELLREPQGVLVLTGPTGSGKTTTLYASLDHIHRTRGDTVNIATLEDPIEVDLPFLNQTERGPDLSFSDGLRAVLRQDPDVLMVGEIRDRETAQTAIQAGLTGHLILTTLHAESAAGVFNRLIDLGVEPFLVASSILATLSQRLVRRLCPDCARPTPLKRRVAERLAAHGIATAGPSGPLAFQAAAGCDACDRRGHRGRRAIFELLPMSPVLRQRVTSKATTDRLEELARSEGMTPLRELAVAAAASGEISLDEVLRVAG